MQEMDDRSSSSDSGSFHYADTDGDDASQKVSRTKRFLRLLKNLPRNIVNFIGIYLLIVFTYFSFIALMASWIYYVAEPPGYLDSLFTVVSALTCTGLITFDTSQVPFGGQFIIWLLILTGSSVFNTVFPLFLRLYRFQRLLWSSTKTCDTRWVVVQRNAILVLIVSALGYVFFVQLGTAIFLIIYSRADRDILDIYDQQGVNYVWGSFFFTASAFNNAGFSLFATNTIPFASEWVMLTTLAWLILAGNTCYPIFMRLWFLFLRIVSLGKSPVINLLHRKPRAYYTHLFNFRQTAVITTFVVTSLALQFTINTALDFNYANGELAGLSGFYKIWNVGFQSISTRNAGFNSVNIALSSSAVLWLYVILMFIGVFPVAASIRSTRRSARVSGKEALMTLVLRDLAFCAACLLVLLIVQYENLRDDPNFTIFGFLFEVISAFGNVGLSLGYGNDVTSLSGRFNTLGKLIIIAVMMAGKHRALATSGDIALAGDRETLDRNKGLMEDPTKAADASQGEP